MLKMITLRNNNKIKNIHKNNANKRNSAINDNTNNDTKHSTINNTINNNDQVKTPVKTTRYIFYSWHSMVKNLNGFLLKKTLDIRLLSK